MKKNLLFLGIAVLAGVAMTSCDESARLAKEVVGSWTGTPETMAGDVLNSTLVETYSFERNADDAKSGTLTINATITAKSTFPGTADGALPQVSFSSSATSSIAGTWTAVDDDDIAVSLDISSLTVSVDPDAISVSSDILTGVESTSIDSLKPQFTAAVHARLVNDLRAKYMGVNHLEDVKVKNDRLLKFEIGNTDYVMTRNGK